jgi:hypothetical protein
MDGCIYLIPPALRARLERLAALLDYLDDDALEREVLRWEMLAEHYLSGLEQIENECCAEATGTYGADPLCPPYLSRTKPLWDARANREEHPITAHFYRAQAVAGQAAQRISIHKRE